MLYLRMQKIILSGGIVHNMLVRQADSISKDVMEFNFNGKGAIFTKREFGFIMGLKMENSVDVPSPPQSNRIKNTNFGHLKKIKNSNVRDVLLYLKRSKLEDKDDMVRLALIYFLECGLLDKESQVSIDLQHLSVVEDLKYFNEYAWGLESYNATISSMHRKATNLPVFKSVGKVLFDNVELYVNGRLRPSNVEEEFIYSANEDYPIPPIPPPKKHKRRRNKAIDTENAEFAYYQQQDASNHEGPSFKNEYHWPDTYENMPINEEGEIREKEMMQNDSEVQFISPLKLLTTTYAIVDRSVVRLKAMEYLLAKQEFNFSHGDMEVFRQKYAIELYNRELST
ncbi:hypothetical protein FNV43_RR21823 [Rhamnella rubrinervis]|uniref:DUF1985 domain-containing protein n=1 Tax=Rhamnella rubrinervis TaxID=2594499 RepID=A0A8K0DT52_9ROSA|nr:hypothetical protein FNV43_RR21823 [Rhamnella rubrinervis]